MDVADVQVARLYARAANAGQALRGPVPSLSPK